MFDRQLKKSYVFAGQSAGFTLLELVVVIILLAILGVSLGNITQYSMLGYIDGKDRNRLSQSGKWVSERIAREIREALPQSVRSGSNANIHCVEFLPIVNSSSALDFPANGPISSFTAVGYDLTFSAGLMIAVMPINSASTYAVNGVIANVASITEMAGQATINLTAATNFTRRSPQARFYLLSAPVAFCLNDVNGEITRYSGHAISASQAFPPSGGSSVLLGENFSANGAVFNYQPGNLSSAGLLQINLRLQNRSRNLAANSESFEIYHEVHVRNVP